MPYQHITRNMDNAISELKEKLSLPTCPKRKCDFFVLFQEIANLLMNKCVISKGEAKYEIVEIEFYLFTSDHQDVITYPRKLSSCQWFFHQSGVDLTFESNTEHFGGILIRGLRDIETRQLTFGPQKCVDLLWDKFNAFKIQENEYPIIVAAPRTLDESIQDFPRWIPVKDEDKSIKLEYWTERVKCKGYDVCSTTDKTDIVFTSPYRFIKFDSINSTPKDWSGYSAKPRVE